MVGEFDAPTPPGGASADAIQGLLAKRNGAERSHMLVLGPQVIPDKGPQGR